jgi:hypothetical protein
MARFRSSRLAAAAIGVRTSTYNAHERAGLPGGRNFDLDQAIYYAKCFATTPEWLLSGEGAKPAKRQAASPRGTPAPQGLKVPVIGYVGAGAATHLYAVAQGDLDEVDAPAGARDATVAVEIRGDSLGPFFNRWLVFFEHERGPATPELIGQLCVVALEDERVLIKQLARGRREGLFTLLSQSEAPIEDVRIRWAAKVKTIARP